MHDTGVRREPNRRKLTELTVTQIKPPVHGNVIVWDQLLPGFGVRLSHTGKRVWVVQLRRPGATAPGRIRIGALPRMNLAEARTKARQMMGDGAPAAPVAFKGLVDEFLAHARSKKGRSLRQNTLDQYRRAFERYAVSLNKRPVAEIARREIAALLAGVAKNTGAPTAAMVRSLLARLFGYAIAVGHIEHNPASFTPGYEVPKRSRVLSDAELRALWQATQDATADEPDDYSMVLRLCIWTGVRRGEAGGLRWSELTDGIWTLPAARTKNGRELILPLAEQTRDALAEWPRLADRDCLFGATSAHGFSNWSRSKAKLDQRLRFNRDFDVHDCRRTVETQMAKLGIQKHVVNLILNHAVGPVTAAYDHYDYISEKRDAMQLWANRLAEITADD
jgi:integrase